MSPLHRLSRGFGRRTLGASALTYGLLLGLLGIVALSAIGQSGTQVNRLFGTVARGIAGVVPAPTPTPPCFNLPPVVVGATGAETATIAFPQGCTRVVAQLWGGGGQSATVNDGCNAAGDNGNNILREGGAGGYTTGTLVLDAARLAGPAAGRSLWVEVEGPRGSPGFAGGGGRAALAWADAADPATSEVLVAGGGGGASAHAGGAGGGVTGETGAGGGSRRSCFPGESSSTGGEGGQSNRGGNGGGCSPVLPNHLCPGTNGARRLGAVNTSVPNYGGFGGNGYFGGGQGGTSGYNGGAGGGGSGYVAPGITGSTHAGSRGTPGASGTSETDRTNAALGRADAGQPSRIGKAVLRFLP